MSADEDERGHRVEPARDVEPAREAGGEAEAPARECPNCHATSVGDVAFCGSCGYDFVTGSEPVAGGRAGARGGVDGNWEADPEGGDGAEEPAEPLPTSLQAAEPLEAYIDPRRDADDIELPTTAAELGLDEDELARRPRVPPPTPPAPGQAREAHDRPEHRPPSRDKDTGWVAELWVDHVWAATRDSDQPVPDAGPPEVTRLTTDNLVVGRTNIERGLHPDLDAGTDAGVSVRHAQLTGDGHRWWIEDLDTSNGTYVGTVGEPLPTEPLDHGERVEIDEDDRVYLGAWTRLVLRRES